MWQPGMTLEQLERETIIAALRFYQGSRVRTARALGMGQRTLTNKINLYRKQGETVPPPYPGESDEGQRESASESRPGRQSA